MKSVENHAEFPRGQLGAPGAPKALNIVAIMEKETRDDQARLRDQSLRIFNVEVLLTKHLTAPDSFNANFTKEDGTSFIKLAPEAAQVKVDTPNGAFHAELNRRNEIALIQMKVEARAPTEARNKVYDAIAGFLDHLSYLAQTPILTGLMRIYDEKNQVFTIDILGPEQEVTLNPGEKYLYHELLPIYALYREFKNSSSAYYRLLCLFKVMEGILGVLRKKGREEAKALGIPFSMPKERVPDHADISEDLRHLIGKPIKEFYDNILEKRYRDVVSHFLVRENVILQVSSADQHNKFAEMAFVCDLCVRVLISNHEALLQRLDAARTTKGVPPAA
jgi:hypothetical protein